MYPAGAVIEYGTETFYGDLPMYVTGTVEDEKNHKVGIKFNNERRMVNTKRAHALVEQLKNKGENDSANAFMVDLYKSYFEDG